MLLASGQIATSATPTPLSSTPLQPKKWVMKALSSNAGQVGIGPASQPSGAALSMANAHLMDPGDDLAVDRTIQQGTVYDVTPADVYVVGNGGVVTWLAFG